MSSRLRRFIFLFLLALPATACSLAGGGNDSAATLPTQAAQVDVAEPEPTDTAVPQPTERAGATATATRAEPADTKPRPTAEPSASPAPTISSSPDLVLAAEAYSHPSGAFSLVPPANWTIEESSGAASFDAPDGTGFIYVQITNAGHALDSEGFANFVTYRDLNFFDDFEDYEVITKEVDGANGAATIVKFLTYEGVAQTVITFYYQYGAIIYSFDFWSDQDFFDAYDALYGDVLDTADVNPDVALDQAEYLWVYTFSGPDGLFTIEVPTAWQYERSEAENTVVDTFYAPDGHAIIQNIAYDDGSPIGRSEAGELALDLLHSSYAADIRIVDDRVQADGSERLTWTSASGDYSGISFFETRGTTFLLLTTMYDNAYEDVYIDTVEYTIGSYTILED
ncbi:MAG: hypothetical protein RRC07_15875 [Anaerolineae bacterium]|nr:hypothetical protein [Anaerolineae bacterium]